ncbi:MAG: hypothetical protein OXF78_00170 [Rhodospirillales bacterium]|nr:hypothetical protein [Rhodospirillales bacterium]
MRAIRQETIAITGIGVALLSVAVLAAFSITNLLNDRFDDFNQQFQQLETRLQQLETRLTSRIDRLDTKLDALTERTARMEGILSALGFQAAISPSESDSPTAPASPQD